MMADMSNECLRHKGYGIIATKDGFVHCLQCYNETRLTAKEVIWDILRNTEITWVVSHDKTFISDVSAKNLTHKICLEAIPVIKGDVLKDLEGERKIKE